MRVLVIPEDIRKDRYMLEPIIGALMQFIGKPQAKVKVCPEPVLHGIGQALNWVRIAEIISRYRGMIDLFLLCVDRDGNIGRRDALDHIEEQAQSKLPASKLFLAENAWQELEVWVLAGHDLPRDWSWQAIRQEVHPKENYFLPFARQRGLLSEPGEGRKTLAQEAARRYDRIRQLCKEDVAVLEERIKVWVDAKP